MLEVVGFIAVCSAPLVLSICGVDGSSSRVELRKPRAPPVSPRTLTQVLDYPSRLEAYVNDHFGGRPQLIELNSLARLTVGASGSPEVVVGSSGWLFLRRARGVLDRHRGLRPFTEAELDGWVQEYERRRQWLELRGIGLYFAVVPNKHTIYGEHLPLRYNVSFR